MTTTKVNLANTVEGILPVANGGTGTSTGVAPGGSTTQVQYNNAGVFAGSANLVWDNTNARLGVGTTSPQKKLSVSNGGAVGLDIDPTGRSGEAATSLLSYNRSTSAYVPAQYDASQHEFLTSNTERMRISSAGNLGIGQSSPSYKLDINKGSAGIIANFTDGVAQTLRILTDANTAAIDSVSGTNLGFQVGSVERMRILSAGDVVIGATAQIGSARFGVQRSGAGEAIRWTDGATGGAITTVASFGTNLNSDALSFTTSSTERLRIASNGAFGLSGANYGTSGQLLKSNGSGSAPSWATPALANYFESSLQTLAAGYSAVTVSHGLGAQPKLFMVVLRCNTIDLGYAVGDEVAYPFASLYAVGGFSTWASATQIGSVVNANLQLPNKSTGTFGTLTYARWNIIFRAWV